MSGSDEVHTAFAVVDEHTLRDKIYTVRGVEVMLDFDLAEIYGFTTSAFNQQVKRNIERFDDDFRFQLTRSEVEQLSISQNVTSIQTKGLRGGRAKLPYAFTESGIYMLMTVLKGKALGYATPYSSPIRGAVCAFRRRLRGVTLFGKITARADTPQPAYAGSPPVRGAVAVVAVCFFYWNIRIIPRSQP